MLRSFRAWALCIAALCAFAPHAAASGSPTATVLITHPRASVLRHYVALVRHHLVTVPNVQFVGVYHASETEDYHDALAYLAHEHITWITLHPLHCPLSEDDVFRNNGCRDEFQRLFEGSQGIIFNGGPDIPPSLYGKPTLLGAQVDAPKRSTFEVSFLVNLLGSPKAPDVVPLLNQRPTYPVLGICMGMQSLNVADGGTLIQDIPSELYGIHTVEAGLQSDPTTWHRTFIHDDPALAGMAPGVFHPIRVSSNAPAPLHTRPDFFPQVLSIHHQAVATVGPDYVVYATSVDGKVIEAMGHKRYANVLGVQYHPERAPLWDPEAVESTNPYDVSPNGPNIAFSTMAHDPASRSYMAAIWSWLSAAIQRTPAAASHT